MRTQTIAVLLASAFFASTSSVGVAQSVDPRNGVAALPQEAETVWIGPNGESYFYAGYVVDPTPADTSRATGRVDSDTPGAPFSGSGVQAGNMGPGNSKGQ